ncbi:DUF3322 and DUF2220 domain-containing protein [Schumannella soli]|uniref:DUF3322 and DUF2220 domain-containing protein n=1 Tax=Schumannella soli TaxID=2590779 RepID=A0A506Y9F6_9MICO|nr:DUF3322 and DUF2220 domain-containing protein [Schumannella soli]TPW77718.1 hypothetical protein FJ657_03425 [Schumannella soli]
MTARLLGPGEVAELISARLSRELFAHISRAVGGTTVGGEVEPFTTVKASTGLQRDRDIAGPGGPGFDGWSAWMRAWRSVDLSGIDGVSVTRRSVEISGVDYDAVAVVRVDTVASALEVIARLGGEAPGEAVAALDLAQRLYGVGATVTAGPLRRALGLPDSEASMLLSAVDWLAEHPDLGTWTLRQVPMPGVHSKWLANRAGLLRDLTGRDVTAETRRRPSVIHFTYVDPTYLASAGRRHDAWTAGDVHDPAYLPRTVVVVENRDSRLDFPPHPATIVIEGAGKAVASLLTQVEWTLDADRIVYWGDIDVDGYAILDHLRSTLNAHGVTVDSILMDDVDRHRYAEFGVLHGRDGEPLSASRTPLRQLTPDERQAYAYVGSGGTPEFRRIEQERIPFADVAAALRKLVAEG